MPRPCLLIALPFPPDGPVGASVRTVGFARHLPDFGWEPTVLSGPYVGPVSSPVPGVTRLGRLGGERPAGHHPPGWRDWLRPLLVPDRYAAWIPAALRQGATWLADHPGAPIISTGPTHACHLVAWCLARRFGAPWLADFADPWIGNPFARRRPWPLARLEAALEAAVLRAAGAVTAASPALLPHVATLTDAAKLVVLENGFDQDAGADLPPYEATASLTLRHVGSWYGQRRLDPLLDALADLPASGKPVRFEQVGGEPLSHPDCHWLPARPYREALALMAQADVLVLIPGASYALPTKLYEYAATGRPILNLGDPAGEAARWLQRHEAGITLTPDDLAGIRAQLARWQRLPMVPATGLSPVALAEYSRQQLTGKMAGLLQTLVPD